jgi:uncharacterized repeat protein (TIGR03803 family)
MICTSLVVAVAVAFGTRAEAQANFTVLHNFAGGSDGANPKAALIADSSGRLYGTTAAGGVGGNGTVFRLVPPSQGQLWRETVLHSFMGGTDGATPVAGLLLKDGILYGTTSNGGTFGNGVVFQLATGTKETILHSFGSNPDGAHPGGGVVFDQQGDLCGTTEEGGDQGHGAVFTLTHAGTTWKETTIHSFHQFQDGYDPLDGLVINNSGVLYGTTSKGGSSLDGVVFSLTRSGAGWSFSTLYSFDPHGSDGIHPVSSLVLDRFGSLYGTTEFGGVHNSGSAGTVFKVTPAGESVLYSFIGVGDGADPQAGVVIDGTGAIYGTTLAGGDFGQGVVFKLTPQTDGSYVESVLHSFTGGSDGGGPVGGLLLDATGALYGTTSVGGTSNLGVVFKLQ